MALQCFWHFVTNIFIIFIYTTIIPPLYKTWTKVNFFNHNNLLFIYKNWIKLLKTIHIKTKRETTFAFSPPDIEKQFPSVWYVKHPGRKPSCSLPNLTGTNQAKNSNSHFYLLIKSYLLNLEAQTAQTWCNNYPNFVIRVIMFFGTSSHHIL
jgi:hypothetical protein